MVGKRIDNSGISSALHSFAKVSDAHNKLLSSPHRRPAAQHSCRDKLADVQPAAQ